MNPNENETAKYWEKILSSHKAEKAHRARGWIQGLKRRHQSKKDRKKQRRLERESRLKASQKRPNYLDYINSKAWRRKKARYYKKHGKICQICGSDKYVELHHLTYKRLGQEPDEDLQALCKGCHQNTHEGYKPWIIDPLTQEYLDICRNF